MCHGDYTWVWYFVTRWTVWLLVCLPLLISARHRAPSSHRLHLSRASRWCDRGLRHRLWLVICYMTWTLLVIALTTVGMMSTVLAPLTGCVVLVLLTPLNVQTRVLPRLRPIRIPSLACLTLAPTPLCGYRMVGPWAVSVVCAKLLCTLAA